MRPAVPDILPSPPPKSSCPEQTGPPWTDNQGAGPTTFFLARERNDDGVSPRECSSSRESMYGVQSLEETISRADSPGSLPDVPSAAGPGLVDQDDLAWSTRRRSTLKPSDLLYRKDDKVDLSACSSQSRISCSVDRSRPLTPLGIGVADELSSLPSSPKSTSTRSLKPMDDVSITDEINSPAIASGGEDEESAEHSERLFDSSSQLIMPSIRMPSRRPFTERGKNLGRFKILVAGANGSGKSSLIKAIVQNCEEIVHVDPIGRQSVTEIPRSRSNPGLTGSSNKAILSEIYASTKPYPAWWSDLEDSRVLRRRKSTGEVVLERNLCFVDAPGSTTSRSGQTQAVVQYMTQQLSRAVAAVGTAGSDFQNMLGGNGGTQVDAVLYLVSEDTLSSDVESIRKLCELSNVIPLIAKADLLSTSQIASLKKSFHTHLQNNSLRPFLFGELSAQEDDAAPQTPFAVSSARSTDDDNMDASVLMSPDYIQPLIASELNILIDKLFDRDNMAWLRHSAAKKLTQSQGLAPVHHSRPSEPRALLRRSTSPGTSLFSQNHSLHVVTPFPMGGSASYTMARVTDYTQNEERLAQVRLAKWAADLQRSLQNERERYAALARGERAVWLTERLGECVVDGTLVPITQTPGWSLEMDKGTGGIVVRTCSNGQTGQYRLPQLSPQDPLGLVQWNDDLRRRSLIILQVVGSFGVVGGLALWLAKTWGLPSQSLSDWRFSWMSAQS